MANLTTTWLGLPLKNPLIPSSSPLMQKIDNLKKMEDAGAAAVVLHSLFEEQIARESLDLDHYLEYGAESSAEARSYFPDLMNYNMGPDGYLEHVRKAKAAVGIPVIASLNGASVGGCVQYAKKIQEAGADALELNTYYVAANPAQSSHEIEEMYLELVREIKAALRIPVAVKLSPYFSAFANMAQCLDRADADGLVLFNRFYQPDFDLERLEVTPEVVLSTPVELPLRLRWVAILYGRVHADLAVTGGVHRAEDVLKCMMAGANVAMMTSALLQHGIEYIREVLDGITRWMNEREYESVVQMRGSMSQRAVAQPASFERANYIKVLRSYDSVK
jgi:dihydroorotate dehydrogenase (fumarate)